MYTTMEMPDVPSFKISVSSHVNFSHAREVLLSTFDKYQVPRRDVIVTICGRSNEPPEIVENGPDREVYIYVPENCYEYSQAYAISQFIDHPRVKADYYVSFHDTCILTERFQGCMVNYVQEMRRQNLDLLYALASKQFNLAGFSHQYIKEHGHNYNRTIDKPTGWVAEHGGYLSYLSFVPPEKVGAMDCAYGYEPGVPLYSDLIRHPIHVASMGIIKFVCNNDADVNPPWQERVRP
jgi:hypothetical protein